MPQNAHWYYEPNTVSLANQKAIKNDIRLQQNFTEVQNFNLGNH